MFLTLSGSHFGEICLTNKFRNYTHFRKNACHVQFEICQAIVTGLTGVTGHKRRVGLRSGIMRMEFSEK